MNTSLYNPPEASLYGETEKNPEPKIKLPFFELLTELFTEPTQLFKKLRQVGGYPWVMPLVVSLLLSLVWVGLWASKVDVDAMLRPVMEANPQLSSSQVDRAIEAYSRFILPMSLVGAVLGGAGVIFFFGLLFWGIGVASREGDAPSYLQGVTVMTLSSLAMAPAALLGSIMCLLRPVGGLRIDQLMPSSLGFFLTMENPKLSMLFSSIEIFTIFSWVIVYLGARHYLRCKPWGASLCVAVMALSTLLKVLMAK